MSDAADLHEGWLKLEGTVQRLPDPRSLTGAWRVSGHTVRVRHDTRIVHRNLARRGAPARVFGRWRGDGSIRAARVIALTG